MGMKYASSWQSILYIVIERVFSKVTLNRPKSESLLSSFEFR